MKVESEVRGKALRYASGGGRDENGGGPWRTEVLCGPCASTLPVRAGDEEMDRGAAVLRERTTAGETWQSIIERTQRIEWRDLCDMVAAALDSLGDLLARGLIHSDVKPENIVAHADGTASLLNRCDPVDGFLTPYYAAPEVWLQQPRDWRSDLFSLGLSVFELITGVVPFEAESVKDLGQCILYLPLPSLRDPPRGIPVELIEFVERATVKNRDERFRAHADASRLLRLSTAGNQNVGDLTTFGFAPLQGVRSTYWSTTVAVKPESDAPTPSRKTPRPPTRRRGERKGGQKRIRTEDAVTPIVTIDLGATASSGAAALLHQVTGTSAPRSIPLATSPLILGRRVDVGISVSHPSISRNQMAFFPEQGAWWVCDLGSSNGTWVNEQRVDKRLLWHGDVVQTGDVVLVYLSSLFQDIRPISQPGLQFILAQGGAQHNVIETFARSLSSSLNCKVEVFSRGEASIARISTEEATEAELLAARLADILGAIDLPTSAHDAGALEQVMRHLKRIDLRLPSEDAVAMLNEQGDNWFKESVLAKIRTLPQVAFEAGIQFAKQKAGGILADAVASIVKSNSAGVQSSPLPNAEPPPA